MRSSANVSPYYILYRVRTRAIPKTKTNIYRFNAAAIPPRETSPPPPNCRKSRSSGTWWRMEELSGEGTIPENCFRQADVLATIPAATGRMPWGWKPNTYRFDFEKIAGSRYIEWLKYCAISSKTQWRRKSACERHPVKAGWLRYVCVYLHRKIKMWVENFANTHYDL